MKNEVFPKGFWVTFAKVTVWEAKPAQSNEKHLFANAKSAIGRTFRKKRKMIRIRNVKETNNDYVSSKHLPIGTFRRRYCGKMLFNRIGRASLSETVAFPKATPKRFVRYFISPN